MRRLLRHHRASIRLRIILGPLLLAIAIILAGCGDSAPEAGEAGFRVALLTPGSIADGGWNAGAYEGLRRIQAELGAEISHVETRTPAEFEESFRDYASRGFDLVFGHGFEYQDAARKVGSEFPDTTFVTTSGNTVSSNVMPMVFELEQATYLCGLIAGAMSRSGKLGLIGGIDLPSIRSTFLAFKAGAQVGKGGTEVREVFIGNFDDTAAAREAALALIEEGADFLMHQANEAGRGVFQAVSERSSAEAPRFAFGTNRNQNAMAPDVILASATLDIPGAFLTVARRAAKGGLAAEPLRLGMNDGVVALELNAALAAKLPAELAAKLERTESEIRSGALVVPRGAF